MLDTDKIQEWTVSALSFDTVSKILPITNKLSNLQQQVQGGPDERGEGGSGRLLRPGRLPPGMNCIKIGLPGKLILSKRKGLLEVLYIYSFENSLRELIFREDLFSYNCLQVPGGGAAGYDLTDDFIDDAVARDDSDSDNELGPGDSSSLKCSRCGKGYRYARKGSGHKMWVGEPEPRYPVGRPVIR